MEALRNIENQQQAYGCKCCGFSSGQALGGHQKKHRVEDQDAAAAAEAAREAFSMRNEQPILISSSQRQIQREDFENLHQEGPNGICLFCLKWASLKLHFDRSTIFTFAIKKARQGKLALKRGGRPLAEWSFNSTMVNTSSSTSEALGINKKRVGSIEAESGDKEDVDLTFRLRPVGYN